MKARYLTWSSILAFLPAFAVEPPPSEPYQRPVEIDVAERFKAAVPGLFEDWLQDRPAALEAAGVGTQGITGAGCRGVAWFYSFVTCNDAAPPAIVGVDVVKTNSLMAPIAGIVKVDVSELCHQRNVVPPGWSKKNFELKAPFCIGKPYADCIAAGSKDAPKLGGSTCTGGPGFTFPFADTVTLTYRWSKERWEFEKQTMEHERRSPGE